MKSFFLQFAGATATLSLLGSAHAVSSSSPSSQSCGAPNVDDTYFSVVGVQGTGVHPRQDLRELEKDTETWDMFIQALARFQAMNQNEKLSYYKIAGMVVSYFSTNYLTQIRYTRSSIRTMGWGVCPRGSEHNGLLSPHEQLVWHMASTVSCSF